MSPNRHTAQHSTAQHSTAQHKNHRKCQSKGEKELDRVCVCVCVCEREYYKEERWVRERKRENECKWERERERERVGRGGEGRGCESCLHADLAACVWGGLGTAWQRCLLLSGALKSHQSRKKTVAAHGNPALPSPSPYFSLSHPRVSDWAHSNTQ